MKTTDLSYAKIASRPSLEGKLFILFPLIVIVPTSCNGHVFTRMGLLSVTVATLFCIYADLSPAMFSYVTTVAVMPLHLLPIFQAIHPYLTMPKEICLPILLE